MRVCVPFHFFFYFLLLLFTFYHFFFLLFGRGPYCTYIAYPRRTTTYTSETSDADACLDEFRELIVAPSGQEVRQLTPAQWDPRGEYTDVVAAVAAASGGGGEEEIRVYRVEREGSRVEYFVVGVDRSEKTVVGVRVLAVES